MLYKGWRITPTNCFHDLYGKFLIHLSGFDQVYEYIQQKTLLLPYSITDQVGQMIINDQNSVLPVCLLG